jgi:gamma-glutamylcyclotransferase (GGCT)/AIG2-like uncharacterized protein YtfP
MNAAAERETVFVYGTLRSGGSNHFRLSGAVAGGAATVAGRLYRIDWYPGLVLDPAGDRVCGEIFEVDVERLRELDAFEGLAAGETEGAEYRRVETVVRLADDSTRRVWVWEWIGPCDETSRIADGDWHRKP